MGISFELVSQTVNDEISSYDMAFYHYDYTLDTYTLEADNSTMDYFSDTAVAGDALILKGSANSIVPPASMVVNVGTALAGTGVNLRWYISTHTANVSGSYAEIEWEEVTSHVTDNTNGFTTTGSNSIDFDSYVKERICAGKYTPITTGNAWWIKCEIDSLTSITEGGANTTDDIDCRWNRVNITGSFETGTITSAGTYYCYDTTKSWTTNELSGRHVWFPELDGGNRIFPIAGNYSNRFYMGMPFFDSPSTNYSYFDSTPAVGTTYHILYTAQDVMDALIADGKSDWVSASMWLPRCQQYRDYIFNCYLYLNPPSNSDYAGIGFYSKNVHFLFGYKITVASARLTCAIIADGMRVRQYDPSTDSGWTQSQKITAGGSNFYWEGHGVTTFSAYFAGFLYGSRFHNSCAYSFVTYFYLYNMDIRNVSLENCQVGNGTNTTGWNVWHSPVGEPLRDPYDTFAVKGFQANKACIYKVGANSRVLDSPAAADNLPFTTYYGFLSPHACDILDKEANTSEAFRFSTDVATDSGSFNFWYRVNLKLVDKDGNPVEDAEVSIVNNADEVQFTDVTDSEGKTKDEYWNNYYDVDNKVKSNSWYHPTEGVKKQYTSGHTEINYNPFVMTISRDGYIDYEATIDITKPTDLTLKLTAVDDPDTDYDYASNYPMSYTESTNTLYLYGSDGSDGKDAMGYDADNPITFDHVKAFLRYTRGEAGAAAEGYTIYASLDMYKGATVAKTYFKDTAKTVVIDTGVHQGTFFTTVPNTQIQFGEIDENGNTYNGMRFTMLNHRNDAVWSTGTSGSCGDILFYDSYLDIQHETTGYCFWRCYTGSTQLCELVDCVLVVDGMRLQGTNSKILRCRYVDQKSSVGPFTVKSPFGQLEDISVNRSRSHFYWFPPHGSATLRKLTAKDNTGGVSLSSSNAVPVYLRMVDCDLDEWTFYGTFSNNSIILRQNTYNVNVRDEDGTPISGASVTLYDKDDIAIISQTTDSNGDITEEDVTIGDYINANSYAFSTYGPFKLVVAKDGYETFENEGDISDPVVLEVPLKSAISTMTTTDSRVAVKLDPSNSTVNRDKVIVL